MSNIEKAWPWGVLIATAWCPACFPALAWVATAMWITIFQWYGMLIAKIAVALIFVSMILAYFTYKRNKFKPTFIITEISWTIMIISYFVWFITLYYILLVFLLWASIWNYIIDRKLPSCKDWKCENK